MALPPQFIRVKRKRADESPVTFLQFEQSVKRRRAGDGGGGSSSSWIYQRRDPLAEPAPSTLRNVQPVIHVPEGARSEHQRFGPKDHQKGAPTGASRTIAQPGNASSAWTTASKQNAAPRRFHMSRTATASAVQTGLVTGVSRRRKEAAVVFVERGCDPPRRGPLQRSAARRTGATAHQGYKARLAVALVGSAPEVPLKKPGTKAGNRTPREREQPDSHSSLPSSGMDRHDQDLDKLAADMNEWVLQEIGANLDDMEQKKTNAERARFKPKPPPRRHRPCGPESDVSPQAGRGGGRSGEDEDLDPRQVDGTGDGGYGEGEDDEGDDEDEWIYDEYVRVPAAFVANDFQQDDVGVLVMDKEEEQILFYGPDDDADDSLPDDEEDENAENHYTADYPEDEVDSDDEYGRHPYGYRNGNASDDEEFGKEEYADWDCAEGSLGEGSDDEDNDMARIRAYLRRNNAFG